MTMRTGTIAIAALAAWGAVPAAPARADILPTLLCGRDDVLRIVERTVRGWNAYNRIEGEGAVETPTAVPNSVICHATMTSVAYELTPAGWIPRTSRDLRRYDVQIVGNRLFVQVPR